MQMNANDANNEVQMCVMDVRGAMSAMDAMGAMRAMDVNGCE